MSICCLDSSTFILLLFRFRRLKFKIFHKNFGNHTLTFVQSQYSIFIIPLPYHILQVLMHVLPAFFPLHALHRENMT